MRLLEKGAFTRENLIEDPQKFRTEKDSDIEFSDGEFDDDDEDFDDFLKGLGIG